MQGELLATARSAQLWQQMRALSAGIRTSRMDPTQFGLQPARPGVTAFLEALQEDVDSSRLEQKRAWAVQAKGRGEGAQAANAQASREQAAPASTATTPLINGQANGVQHAEAGEENGKTVGEQSKSQDADAQQEEDKMEEG